MATFAVPKAENVIQVSTHDGAPVMQAVPSTPAAQATVKSDHAKGRYVLVAYALVVIGALLAWGLDAWLHPAAPVVVQGVGVFAALYVAAQAIERVIEPFTEWTGTVLGGVEPPTEDAAQGKGDLDRVQKKLMMPKADLKYCRALAIQTAQQEVAKPGDGKKVGQMAKVAADAQSAVVLDRRNSTVLVWGIATFLGIVVSALIGLALMRSVGVHSAPRVLDMIVTGLAIGGGSKPLHDLISNLQASKDQKKDPAEVTPT